MKKNVLFAGLGNMGYPMARNLVTRGQFNVFGYDVAAQPIEKAAKEFNIRSYKDIAFSEIDCVISIVPDVQSLKTLYTSSGIFSQCKPNTMLIDCSTIGTKNALNVGKLVSDHDMVFVDAPVTGGVMKAANGQLGFLVGADNPSIFETAKQYLQPMAGNVFNCKKMGNGQTVKVVNNMGVAIQMRSVVEMMLLGESLGIDTKTLTGILVNGTSNCWALDTTNPVPNAVEKSPANRDYEGGFKTKLMLKDVMLALEEAKETGLDLKFAKMVAEDYQQVVDEGFGERDFGYLYQIVKERQHNKNNDQ